MTRDEARRTLLRQVDALARRDYDDAPLVAQAIEVLSAPTNREDIMRAVNAGTDLVLAAMSEAGALNDAASNVSNLIVCAIGTVLEKPGVTIVDVLADSFDDTAGQWREELGDEVVDRALELRDATFDASSIEADPMAFQRHESERRT